MGPAIYPRTLIRAGAAIGVLVVLLLYSSAFKGTYIDDAFIQLQYAHNLVTHHTWGFYADRSVNTSTSALNVILTALFGLALGSMTNAVIVLTALEFALLLGCLLLISRRLLGSYYAGIFCFLAFATNPLLLSTLGLEGLLYTTLVFAAVAVFLQRRYTSLAVILGLLAVTRADGVLLFLLFLLLVPAPLAARIRFTLVYAATALPWYLYSWIALGSVVPDTLLIKTTQRPWGGHTYATGLALYWERYRSATFLSFALLPALLLALWWLWRHPAPGARRVVAILMAYGATHFAAYSLLAVPPYHWYYLHQLIPIVFVGAFGVGALFQGFAGSRLRPVRVAAWLPLLLPVAGIVYLWHLSGFPLREAPIHSNWATQARYREIGLWLEENIDPGVAVNTSGEIGTLAYYSQRPLRNEFSDANVITQKIADDGYESRPLTGWLYRLNYLWRRPQPPLPPAAYWLDGVSYDPGEEGGNVVMSWPTSTAWIPHGRIYLHKLSTTAPDPGSTSGDLPDGGLIP